MKQRRGFDTNDFSSSSDPYLDHEDADPRVGLVNLADVMLVFACGLMVALVVSNNVELSSADSLDKVEMTEIESDDIDALLDELNDNAGSGYERRGTIYEDPTTGQLYMLEETEGDESADADGGDNGAASESADTDAVETDADDAADDDTSSG